MKGQGRFKQKAVEDAIGPYRERYPQPGGEENHSFFFVRAKKAYHRIEYDAVRYLESLGGGTSRLVTLNETLIVRNTLLAIQEHLPPSRFLRIHAAFIVGVKYVACFENNERWLKLLPPPDTVSGYALRIDFPIGKLYEKTIWEHLVVVKARRCGEPRHIKKLQLDADMEALENSHN